MKKTIIAFACLALCVAAAGAVNGKETESVTTLPPVVAQTYGMAGTIIIWHTLDGDGRADYKATYIFKDGKLHQISQTVALQDELRYQILGR
jgi:ABC-type glycerol-3-phosphate transport system substrate-binding protein